MIGDWVILSILSIVYTIVLILSIIVSHSAELITPVSRRDNGIMTTYNSMKTASTIGIIVSSIMLFLLVVAFLVLLIQPLTSMLDNVNRIIKIVIKSLVGIGSGILILLSGYYMSSASTSLRGSNTYRISRLQARSALDDSIASLNLASTAYYVLGGIIILLFVILAIYDLSKGFSTPTSTPVTSEIIEGPPTLLSQPQPQSSQTIQAEPQPQLSQTILQAEPQPQTVSQSQTIQQVPVVQVPATQ